MRLESCRSELYPRLNAGHPMKTPVSTSRLRCESFVRVMAAIFLSIASNHPPATHGALPSTMLPPGTLIHADLEYARVENTSLKLDLYCPPRGKERPPLLVWIHGGAWQSGSKEEPSPALKLLPQGYAVAHVQYRLSSQALWPAQMEDCAAAIGYLRERGREFHFDEQRIAVWGSSAGGHLAAMLGARTALALSADPQAPFKPGWTGVQAVVDWFGPTDFLQMDKAGSSIRHNAADSPESRLIGGAIPDHPDRTAQANPIHHLSRRKPGTVPPFLIMHGTKDNLVPFHQSELLRDALRGEELTFVPVPEAGHGFQGDEPLETVRGFLARTLLDPNRWPSRSRGAARPYGIFSKSNLAAWCIVPFDARKRGPEERAAMLENLGFRLFAYDYRAEHIPTFDQELESCARRGVKLSAWWFPGALNEEARTILNALSRHGTRAQLWITGGGSPARNEEDQRRRVGDEARRIEPIAKAAAEMGCTIGLYNHGGWFGEPENQIAIIEHLASRGVANVGIVYNQHHGHDHLDRFESMLAKMKPHLIALNLNGMDDRGDRMGRKILPLGQGARDLEMLRIIERSGWRGPIGLLNHTDEDAEARLLDNLEGLEWLTGIAAGRDRPKPVPRSWKPASN
ncbi:MAG: hypothetical protein FJ404_15260 [Verrucomicrobia bacterium]|nr:hypothetical protein [Verrucomicrobiota bacterium]